MSAAPPRPKRLRLRTSAQPISKYATERGYQIIRWYVDDGISGDSTEKRHGFLQMIEDAKPRLQSYFVLGPIAVRSFRFDRSRLLHIPPRRAGVKLVTLQDGEVDWDSSVGRIMGGVNQEGKKQQLIDLSNNVTRGQLMAVQNGGWIGTCPYAYKLEGPRKKRQIVLGDPGEGRIVKRIFKEFCDDGRSMSNIADRLNAEGIPSPGGRGKPWRFDTAKTILENPAYVGDQISCRWSYGKFHHIENGQLVKGGRRGRNPESEWIVNRDHHEPLVTRELFARAKKILAKGKTGRSPYKPDENPYLLTGILRCGKCGASLWGIDSRKYKIYECSHRKKGCEGCTVREDRVLNAIAEHLETKLGIDIDYLDELSMGRKIEQKKLPKAFDAVRKLVSPPRGNKADQEAPPSN